MVTLIYDDIPNIKTISVEEIPHGTYFFADSVGTGGSGVYLAIQPGAGEPINAYKLDELGKGWGQSWTYSQVKGYAPVDVTIRFRKA